MFGNFFQRVKNLVTGDGWQTDEEERRKEQQRQQQQQQQRQNTQRSSAPQPGTVVQPQQSNITDFLSNSLQPRGGGLFEMLEKAQPEQKPQEDKQAELDRLTQANLEAAKKQREQGESWLGRNILNRGNIQRDAEVLARSRAARQYQEQHGWNRDPAVLAYSQRTRELGEEHSRDIQRGAERLQKVSDAVHRAGEIAQYVPVTGSVLNVGLAAADRATGSQNRDIANARARLDFGMTQDELEALPDEQRNKLEWVRRASLGLSPLDFVGFGGLVKAPARAALKNAGVKGVAKSLVRSSAVPFVAGTGISAGAQQWLTGEVDPLEALKSGLITTGVSHIFPGRDAARQSMGAVENLYASPGGELKKVATNAFGEPSKIAVARPAGEAAQAAPGELAAGVGSPHMDFIPDNQLHLADNTPAYQRGVPETVGEAQFQANQGIYNAPDTLFDADARMLERPPEVPDPLDTPAFMRRSPEVLDAANARLAQANNLVEMLQKAPSDQEIRFNQPQQMADLPTQRQRDTQSELFQLQKANLDETAPARALGERRAAQREVDEIENAIRAGEDPALTSPVQEIPQPAPTAVDTTPAPVAAQTATDIDTAVPAEITTPGVQVVPDDAAPTPDIAPESQAIIPAREAPAPTASAEAPVTTPTGEAGVTAPRTRNQLSQRFSDDQLRENLVDGATFKDSKTLKEAQQAGEKAVRETSPDQIVSKYSGGKNMQTPEDFFEGIAAMRRLEQIGTPEAQKAAVEVAESIANKSSEGGSWLRATQILFEDAPPSMQTDMLMRKLSKAGMDFGDDAAREADVRGELMKKLSEADTLYRGEVDPTTGAVKSRGITQVKGEISELMADLDSGAKTAAEVKPQAESLAKEYQKLIDKMERKNGEVMDVFEKNLPKDKMSSKVGFAARLAMLSSPAGRAFDVISTTATALLDTADRAVSSGIARTVYRGNDSVKKTGPSLRRVLGDYGKGLKKAKEEWGGTRRVTDVWNEIDVKSRSDIKKASGPLSRKIKAATEAPTYMTEGIRRDELRRLGRQRAAEAGYKGKDAKVYADLFEIGAKKADQYAARQEWLKANMLHDNKVTKLFNAWSRALEKLPVIGPSVKNLTIPFSSFAGGNIQRAFTDRNVLHNVWQIRKGFKNGNPQMVADNLAKLGTNTAGAAAASIMLAESGVITNQDANGDNYDGLYLAVGDRRIPIAFAGQFAPMLIGGYAMNQATKAENPGDTLMDFFGNVIPGLARTTDAASMFSGDNNLMNRMGDIAKIGTGESDGGEKVRDAFLRLGGDSIRQYIPSLFGDINAGLDQTDLNPTREDANTKVTKENPETGRQVIDVPASELRKIQARIPFMAQNLERREGVLAKDLLDRVMKSTRMGDARKAELANQKRMEDRSADFAARGVPDYTTAKTIEAFNSQVENAAYEGKFKEAIEGLQARYNDIKDNPDVSNNTKKQLKRTITEYEVLSDNKFSMSDFDAYKSIGVKDWRKLGDPKSEHYNKDAYERLWALDVALAERKVGAGRGLNKDGQKYSAKKSSSGSRGGRGGRGGSGGSRSNTVGSPGALAKIDFGKLRAEQTSTPRVPTITKLKPGELKKKRKITVSRS